MKLALVKIGFWLYMITMVSLDVPLIMQLPEYPTGCESVATVMVLQYYGFDIDCETFITKYLDTTNEVYENVMDDYFLGNPKSYKGWACNPSVICNAVTKYFNEINEKELSAYDLTGTEFNLLLNELVDDNPVLIWVTIDYVEPYENKGEWGSFYNPSHTVVLKGFNRDTNEVYINDSLQGDITLPYNEVEDIYNKVGKKSLVIK